MIVQVDNYGGSARDVDAPIQAPVESDPVGRRRRMKGKLKEIKERLPNRTEKRNRSYVEERLRLRRRD